MYKEFWNSLRQSKERKYYRRRVASQDEDPNSFIQLFEVTCEANEVVDQGQRLRIFQATLRDEAANWYGNLAPQERGTYQMLKDAFLAKFKRQGFQDRLSQQMGYLRQGINESINHYIQRMETLMRKMGTNAPNDETLKRGPGSVSVREPGQGSPTLTTPAFVTTTSTLREMKPALIEERILELVTQAIKAATMVQEAYTMKQEVVVKPNQGVFRSNTWCENCHGFNHVVTKCPESRDLLWIDRHLGCLSAFAVG
ncbi:hypothetical protein KP509_07G018900 [Ceratopteris richardii]|uniref:Retrotransposon gag domain-containing protein n=1 Tax=Ceratopteris richardii TaxID=49495 RepID=A0A8T2U7Z5_CERRI|nr:hypothetical protein KP509_07G018900 [Ceratopteris richardii]